MECGENPQRTRRCNRGFSGLFCENRKSHCYEAKIKTAIIMGRLAQEDLIREPEDLLKLGKELCL